MKSRFKNWSKRLRTGYGIAILSLATVTILLLTANITSRESVWDLLASVVSPFMGGASTTLFFMPYGDAVITPGDTTSVDININTKVPINALGATISYSSSTLEIVGISKQKSIFNLWTEDTSISEDSGQVHFSGGTTDRGGVMGTGTLITLTVRAKSSGKSLLNFSNIEAYTTDGSGKQVATNARDITYTISAPQTTGTVGSGAASIGPSQPSADLNNDNKIDLIDISILTVKLVSGYDPRYDLNSDGSVNLGDLATLLSKLTH